MVKKIKRAIYLAAAAALVCVCCDDNSAQANKVNIGEVLDKITGGGTAQNAHYTLTVNVSPTEGTVTRNPNADSYKAGTKVTVTVTPKAGYEFLGWSGTLNDTTAQLTIVMNGDKMLAAGFKKEDDDRPIYDVYFNANGAGGSAPLPTRMVSGKSITLPGQTSMEKPGYSLAGWTKDKSGTETIYAPNTPYTVTDGVTLYAKWIPIYTITYNTNGATTGNAPTAVTADSGTVITLPNKGDLSKGTGYSFSGWSTNNTGAGDDYREGASYTVRGNTTLYARWNEDNLPQHSIGYNGNGNTSGSITNLDVMYEHGTTVTLRSKGDLARTGYAFEGWCIDQACTGTVYPERSSYTVTKDVMFYAKWVTLPNYTVTFNSNGAAGKSPMSTGTYSGDSIPLPGQGNMEKTGFSFGGWNTNANGTGTDYAAGSYYKVTRDITLYAKWTVSAPNVPTNVTADAASSSSIAVSWSAVSGAAKYYVYRSTSASGSYSSVTSTTYTSFTNTGLSSGTTYYYKVSAYNDGGESSQSSYASATTNSDMPNAPSGVSASAVSSSSIAVSWSAVSGATEYYVYRSASASGSYSLVEKTSSTSVTNTGLSSGTTYYYKVSSYNNGGESSQSSYASATTNLTVPSAPTNVSATAASSNSITVSWSTVSGASGYYVYRSTSASGSYSQVENTSSASVTNTGLSSGTTYYYKVSAYNNGGESSQSSYVSATTNVAAPNTPTNVSATAASSSSITVSWSAVSGASGYNVYRSTSASGSYSQVENTSSASVTNTGLSSGTTYYYKISAYNDGGESSQSSYASATTNLAAPNTPTNVSATVASSSSITVRWSAVSGASGYYVYRSTSASGSYSQVENTSSTSITNTGLSSSTTYYYKISAYNNGGESSQSSYASATTNVAAPNTPIDIRATAVSSSSITVSWSAVSGATGYYVYRSTNASSSYSQVENTSSASVTNTGLSSGTTYYYKVSAYNDGGESSQSSYASATTNLAVPSAPTSVSATAASSSSITVSWSAVSGASGYYVYRSTSASGSYSQVENTSSTSVTNTGLSSSTTYYYKVSAYNNGGESSQSSYGNATTAMGMITDTRDNKTYKFVKIGNQIWMAENLNFQPSTGNSWCYDNNTENCNKYGRLYDWNTMMAGEASSDNVPSGVQGVCPSGWHLPSRGEWGALAMAAGGTGDYGAYGGTAGTKLKSTSGWYNNGNGTDDFGFSALPGGFRYGSVFAEFEYADTLGCWRTATEGDSYNAYFRQIKYDDGKVGGTPSTKEFGMSVRCIKDDER
jgi:uncharacterized protein (TIGR02145 family)/uncharacterized repeat protein (TIGR02543 family)